VAQRRFDVLLATCADPPAPDPETPRIRDALRERGLRAELAVWDDPERDWSETRACVIRSTWDYDRRLEAFLAWTERASRATSLWNPASAIRWNCHKGYLLDLASRGIPVVPTELLRRGSPRRLDDVLATRGWSRAVAKPAVSLGSVGTARVQAGDPEGAGHLEELLREKDALVQPYVESIEEEGELSLVFLGGALSHAVRKVPSRGDFRVQLNFGGRLEPAEARPDAVELARAALAEAPGRLLYARADLVSIEGSFHLMELELIEPAFFLEVAPQGLDAICRAILSTL
jgi:glutathione synthase/RimK-type ligase-like ATP-grasp enzyme